MRHLKSRSQPTDAHPMPGDKDEQRQYQRHAFRLPCEFTSPEGSQRGLIANISARGFFIHTRAKVEGGLDIVVTIDNSPTPQIQITGIVARSRKSHRSMSAIELPGIGVQITSAPEDYYQLVIELEGKE